MSALDSFSRQTTARHGRVSSLVGDITRRVTRYRTYRQTLNELQALSDRELADLGLSRSMCRAVAYRSAYDG